MKFLFENKLKINFLEKLITFEKGVGEGTIPVALRDVNGTVGAWFVEVDEEDGISFWEEMENQFSGEIDFFWKEGRGGTISVVLHEVNGTLELDFFWKEGRGETISVVLHDVNGTVSAWFWSFFEKNCRSSKVFISLERKVWRVVVSLVLVYTCPK